MRNVKRLGALLLAALVSFSLVVWPSAASEQPDPWAADSMAFALEHGLLAPEEVAPRQPTTRSQLAAFTARLLKLSQMADLSSYTDVTTSNPYYQSLSKAVAIGLFEGNNHLLTPQSHLTREQAFTVLARCFGVPDGDPGLLEAFQDHLQVSDWAAGPVAGMIAAGYVKGSGATLSPQNTITQQELIHLLCQMCGAIVTDGVLPANGSVTLQTGDTLLADVTIDGNLYLCGGFQQVELSNVQINGRLMVYGGTVHLTGGSSAREIVCRGPDVQIYQDGAIPVQVTAGTATLWGGGLAMVSGNAILQSGIYSQVDVLGGSVTVREDAQITLARLLNKDSQITGAGSVRNAVLFHPDCNITAPTNQVQTLYDPGIDQVRISAVKAANEPTPTSPGISTTVQFSQVDNTTGLGVKDGVRYCTLSWYVDGKLVEKQRNFPLTEGAQASFQTTATYSDPKKTSTTLLVRLSYGGEVIELSQTVNKHVEQLYPTKVGTMVIEGTILRTTPLYSSMRLSGRLGTVPAGTKVTYLAYSTDENSRQIRLSDGRVGWVSRWDLSISTKNYTQATDYPQATKEYYVNSSGYKSSSRYLVWVSRLTQKVNIFEGSAQNWKLIHTFACATGANTTPTVPGVFTYYSRVNKWDYGTYYVKRPMIFNGGHAFHTRTYRTSNDTLLDPTIGRPVSHGCIRMYDEAINWMWNNLPFGTTVVVY